MDLFDMDFTKPVRMSAAEMRNPLLSRAMEQDDYQIQSLMGEHPTDEDLDDADRYMHEAKDESLF